MAGLTKKQIESLLDGTSLMLQGQSGNYSLVNRYANSPVFAARNLGEIRDRITMLLGV